MDIKQAAFLKRPEADLPDKDYDLAGVIHAGRALERSEADLATWHRRAARHTLGWGLVALTVGAALYELIKW